MVPNKANHRRSLLSVCNGRHNFDGEEVFLLYQFVSETHLTDYNEYVKTHVSLRTRANPLKYIIKTMG